ncbi:MAG: cytochrome c oxidase subunit II [Alphaproteobacteria bacterium]|nr:cytochrome c oxidase subunit II [Alphaproteobacteria bacterium]MBM3640583.1 cytochrome c oxidase subunit II [Alphaproteobacteria bacterium]
MNFYVPSATVDGREIDFLILALSLVSCAVLALVFGLILLYMVRYRAESGVYRGAPGRKTWRFEISWTVATLAVFFALFIWGGDLYVRLFQPPADALQIYVVGKQWMWKVEHQGGQHEINALHIPINRPIQLVMTSEDVIHDFSVPAFRIKHDVLPGRYESIWFEAKTPGTFELFCTQLCGVGHYSMTGEVVVMSQPDFENWLSGGAPAGEREDLAAAGKELFTAHGCSGCHGEGGVGGTPATTGVNAPALAGLLGRSVKLQSGATVTADEKFIRDCILTPDKTPIAGYPQIMPSFSGQISEEKVLRLIAYIKSLKSGSRT